VSGSGSGSVINHPLSVSSIYYDSWHTPYAIYVPDSLFPQSFSKFSLVYLLAWHPPLHIPYISLPNRCPYHATCFAVVPRLCHLILVSLNPLLGTRSCSLMPHIHLTILISAYFPFLWARSHFHATYYFAHSCCTVSLSLSMMYPYW